MIRAVIQKNRIDDMLGGIMAEHKLVAPVCQDGQGESGIILFGEVKNTRDIILDDAITYKSPKEFLFPQMEAIMSFGPDNAVNEAREPVKTVIFGVRPCDLEAIKVLTAVFTNGKFKDPYFTRRLENTVIVGMGCGQSKPGCFCDERGIDKAYSRECDIFLTGDKDIYLADIFSEKGKNLLKDLGIEMGNIEEIPRDDPETGGILEITENENILFDKIDWESISRRCIGCGTCTYICPTCHCFEFRDVADKGTAKRYRYWDSCMYPKFTLHASGHNPRPGGKERYRQRVMHKYVYIRQNFGYVACTGCGRCIRSCPAGMNIRSVVKTINSELENLKLEE